MKKKLLLLFLSVVMLFTVTACDGSAVNSSLTDTSSSAEESAATQPEVEIGGFSVDGTKLIDGLGNEFIMRGINHAHTWYKNQLETALPAIADTGANTVRIVLSNGVKYDKDSKSSVEKVVEMCKQYKMIAILEIHDATGSDKVENLQAAVDYWIEMKDVLIGNEAYVILNVANEWYGTWSSLENWRDAYLDVIPQLREAGIKNTIMVDAAGWGQETRSVIKYASEILAADVDANTMFSVHMYGTAGKNEKKIKSFIDQAKELGLCIAVGEFGHNHSDGDVDEATIMSYCEETGTGYCAWSWKGNSGGVEYLDIAVEWDGSKLSSDWGEIVINGENGIKATSKICSVFTA